MLNFLNNLTDDLTERRNINMILENATDMAQLNSVFIYKYQGY